MKITTTILVFCVAALLSLGVVILYSSSMGQTGGHWVTRQLIWCGLGLTGGICAACIDYRHLKKISWLILLVALVLLVLVLIPGIGVVKNGARRWFNFGPASLQPSELGKIGLILFLAWYAERYQRFMHEFWKGLVIPGLVISAVLGSIFLEPDYGTTGLLAAISAILLILGGARLVYLAPPVVVGVAAFCVAIWNNPVRLQRIMAFVDLEEHKMGTGFQAYQAMIALGAGGPTGLGLGNGRQKLGFVPEHHTDFIFSIIGEELGLIATIGVVLAFILILVTGLIIAWRSRDQFGFLLASGITFLITLQAFINIGVVTSVLPNKGLPLPFISHGGSNLFVMLTSVGLLMSVARFGSEPSSNTVSGEIPLTQNI